MQILKLVLPQGREKTFKLQYHVNYAFTFQLCLFSLHLGACFIYLHATLKNYPTNTFVGPKIKEVKTNCKFLLDTMYILHIAWNVYCCIVKVVSSKS